MLTRGQKRSNKEERGGILRLRVPITPDFREEQFSGRSAQNDRGGAELNIAVGASGAGERSRTFTGLRPTDFESAASAIPPLRR